MTKKEELKSNLECSLSKFEYAVNNNDSKSANDYAHRMISYTKSLLRELEKCKR